MLLTQAREKRTLTNTSFLIIYFWGVALPTDLFYSSPCSYLEIQGILSTYIATDGLDSVQLLEYKPRVSPLKLIVSLDLHR